MSQQINLVSPLLLKKRYAFGVSEMALALGLLLAVALAWAGYVHYRAGLLEARAAQREALQAAAQQEIERLAAAAARPASALLAERVRAGEAQVKQREALLASVGGTVAQAATGFSSRMRALAQGSTDGVWLNGFTFAEGHVALEGSALNAGVLTTYIDRLGRQAAFSGMPFSGMDAVPGRPAGDGANAPARQLAHIDFRLNAGSRDRADDQGGSDVAR